MDKKQLYLLYKNFKRGYRAGVKFRKMCEAAQKANIKIEDVLRIGKTARLSNINLKK